MGCLRLFTESFVDEDILANLDASSEQAAFPKENAFNKNRRSKVWRSNGYWEITSSNNEIDFQETAATPLTATIATGNYTSTSSLLTAIKTALDAAGASTYTVTQDSTTLKIVITSNGAGGGGIFELLWSTATAGTVLGFGTTDQTGALTYTAPILRIHTEEYILFDMGISSNPQAFSMTGPRNGSLGISPTATINIEGNETDNFSTPSFSQSLTYDDEVLVAMSETGLHTEGLRYWRISITDLDNSNGYVEIGAFFLGDWFSPTVGEPQFPFRRQYVDNSVTVFAEDNVSFSDLKQQTGTYSFTYFGMTKDELQDFTDLFDELGTATPFFVSFDSDAVFSTVVNRMVKFVKFSSEPQASLVAPNVYEVSVSFREEL